MSACIHRTKAQTKQRRTEDCIECNVGEAADLRPQTKCQQVEQLEAEAAAAAGRVERLESCSTRTHKKEAAESPSHAKDKAPLRQEQPPAFSSRSETAAAGSKRKRAQTHHLGRVVSPRRTRDACLGEGARDSKRQQETARVSKSREIGSVDGGAESGVQRRGPGASWVLPRNGVAGLFGSVRMCSIFGFIFRGRSLLPAAFGLCFLSVKEGSCVCRESEKAIGAAGRGEGTSDQPCQAAPHDRPWPEAVADST